MNIKLITPTAIETLWSLERQREDLRQRWASGSAFRPVTKEDLEGFDKVLAEFRKKAWTNLDKLSDALDKVNGKATAHTYCAADIQANIDHVEKRLAKSGVPKTSRGGIKVTLVSEVPTSKSYARKGAKAIATRVELERRASGWVVTHVAREERWAGPGGKEIVRIHLTPNAEAAITAHALKGYCLPSLLNQSTNA